MYNLFIRIKFVEKDIYYSTCSLLRDNIRICFIVSFIVCLTYLRK